MSLISAATLLTITLPIALILWFISLIYSSNEISGPTPIRCIVSIVLPFIISFSGFYKNSLSFTGAVLALIIGFIISLSNSCFTASLLTFFITSSVATKYKNEIKRQLEDDFKEGGQRNWVQVISNGVVAAELAFFYYLETGSAEIPIDFIADYNLSWLSIGVLGSLCCANGDTWASELGSVLSNGNPYLITTLRSVPKGTNGGVSLIGLIVSALGGLVVSISFMLTNMICRICYGDSEQYASSPEQWPLLLVGLFAGLFGSIIDSLLGATLQYSGFNTKNKKIVQRKGPDVKHICGKALLDNHSVNLLSNFITAFVSPYFAFYLWSYYYEDIDL
ncbi:transmembrane protein 19-like [Oppia nitens]|uniref:transmembrane protein 19-like n=1 Tax=Oppia nitens TaxID=1686743 RepID=UPI0023DAED60|nr:transmembrane protein 19-like [Oppia nitens]